ncbi:MAG: efflux RND transporter periplasmic adaptor subunit, partial [Bacteroidales bacterium]|nr:efflux RND transporter periplasmic adaptor subunit [Bacteroidales bacterium]
SFQVGGNVEKVLVRAGDRVEEGQLLASLDKKTAFDAYNAAKASLSQAQDAYQRLEKVHQHGSLPEVKWVEMQTKLAQAQSMEAIAKKSLEDCNLYAPFSGVIASRSIEQGMNILPYVPVLNLMKINDLKVRVSIPENEIAFTEIGQKARIEVSALQNAVFNGKIIEKGIEAHSLSRSYPIKISIDDAQQQLLPGMVCKVYLNNENESSAFVIPNEAVQLSYSGERFVWVVDEDVAKRKFIKISDLTKNGVVVSEGLLKGDRVIIAGYHKVSEGMKISIKD